MWAQIKSLKPTIQVIIASAFAAVLLAIGFNTYGAFSLVFLLSGVFCSAFALNVGLQNHKTHRVTKGSARCWAFVLFLVGTAGVGRFWYEKLPPPNPHLVLYVHSEDSPDVNLQFTNKSLFPGQDESGFKVPPKLPFLVAEVQAGSPHVVLKFGLQNEVPPKAPEIYSSDVERPEIMILLAKPEPDETLKWSADAKWESVTTDDTNFQGQALVYRFPRSLPPRRGDTAPGITFDMQERLSAKTVVAIIKGKGIPPVAHCFKLIVIPSDEPSTKLRFDTSEVIGWHWKYRPVAYQPLDTQLTVSPSHIQLSDGTNTFGTKVVISNPSPSNLYAITLSVEIENGIVPISSPIIELSKPKNQEDFQNGELPIMFEASVDFVGYYSQHRLFVIPVLQAKEDRVFWIRGTILTNSFADISVWQAMGTFPKITYSTNGMWNWPVLSSNSPYWMHLGAQPMDLGFGIMAWRGIATNGFTNETQIIPSHP